MRQSISAILAAPPAATLLLGLLAVPLVLLVRVSLYRVADGHGFYTPNTWTLITTTQ
ncbi:MAG: hypothetical protein U0736_20905 [Gemmataceae bacterium]